ncbi:MAG: DUF6090 family protein [Pseudomonadota bacterium]
MILRRIRAHIEAENWFAVAIDFAVVVVGVFIGIQVGNWNAAQQEADTNRLYLQRIADDIDTDTQRLRQNLGGWKREIDDTALVERFLAGDPISQLTQWETLVSVYFSAGWSPFTADTTTYDELVSSGRFARVGNLALREEIADYHALIREGSFFYDFNPPLREMVRGKYDGRTQAYIWERCFSEETYRQIRDGEVTCPPPDWNAPIDRILADLRADPELLPEFRYTQSIRFAAYTTGEADLERSMALAARIREFEP